MITMSSVINRFSPSLMENYGNALLPSHLKALSAMEMCRTHLAHQFVAVCDNCGEQQIIPHSCGHRSCPHCQHFESQRWLERQSQTLVPNCNYFLITFTIPEELRNCAWHHQRIFYDSMMDCAWQTLNTFSHNHRNLQGQAGAIAVLHTQARDLHYHPHVHVIIPAAALDRKNRLFRSLPATTKYLFSHKALAKVFRGKLLDKMHQHNISTPEVIAQKWVVDCKCVGDGKKALVYLGRYLYRGVIQEKDIIAVDDETVTYRWRDAKSGKNLQRKVDGATFLWMVIQHVLPRRLRRSRNHGFLHPNGKSILSLLKLLIFRPPPAQEPLVRPQIKCRCCGSPMSFLREIISKTDYPIRA